MITRCPFSNTSSKDFQGEAKSHKVPSVARFLKPRCSKASASEASAAKTYSCGQKTYLKVLISLNCLLINDLKSLLKSPLTSLAHRCWYILRTGIDSNHRRGASTQSKSMRPCPSRREHCKVGCPPCGDPSMMSPREKMGKASLIWGWPQNGCGSRLCTASKAFSQPLGYLPINFWLVAIGRRIAIFSSSPGPRGNTTN